VAVGEPVVGPLGAAVGHLDGPEELLLEPVGVLLVELLVGVTQRRERDRELIRRGGNVVEELLSGFGGVIGHGHRARRACGPRP
jgi:hypothetical protein